MISGQEMERVYSYNSGARTGPYREWHTMNCTYCGECDLIGDLMFSQVSGSCATDTSVST